MNDVEATLSMQSPNLGKLPQLKPHKGCGTNIVEVAGPGIGWIERRAARRLDR
jgi:hypothetical protein